MMKYNPAFLTDEQLIFGFVIRTKELESILSVIRENTSGVNQHILVEGPRGSGKTTLVQRVAAEVRNDGVLSSQWYPIVFAEESYMVQTPGEFWLEALFHLEHQSGDSKWGQIYHELKQEKDETRLRESCLSKLIDFADEQKKKLLLVVENMQMLLGDQLSHDEAWVLRQTLQHEAKIMMLCTGLAGKTGDFDKESKAMYELFKRIELKPLTDEESKILWEIVASKPIADKRIRPINILTGGNPRLVSIISNFGKDMSFKELMQNLIQLVDDNTEYFKSHLDSIAPVERKVYLALAEIWDPALAKDVAAVARLEVNKTSSILVRLEQEGRVAVELQRGRKKYYKVAERMYNIYYLMRRRGEASNRVKALVHFIVHFFEVNDLLTVLESIASEACGCDLRVREDLCCAFMEILRQTTDESIRQQVLARIPKSFLSLPEINAVFKTLPANGNQKKAPVLNELAEKIYTSIKKGFDSNDFSLLKSEKHEFLEQIQQFKESSWKWGILGWLHAYTDETQTAIACFEKANALDTEHGSAFYAVLSQLARLYCQAGEYSKARSAYEEFLKTDEGDYENWLAYGQLLHNQLKDYTRAEEAYLRILQNKPNDVECNKCLCWLYLNMEQYKKAESTCAIMIDLHSECIDFYFIRGLAAFMLRNFETSEKYILHVINNMPEAESQYVFIAMIKMLQKNIDASLEYVKKALLSGRNLKGFYSTLTDVVIKLSAYGHSRELSEMLAHSSACEDLQPLVIALKLYRGEQVVIADEVLEVAKDVVKKIEETAMANLTKAESTAKKSITGN